MCKHCRQENSLCKSLGMKVTDWFRELESQPRPQECWGSWIRSQQVRATEDCFALHIYMYFETVSICRLSWLGACCIDQPGSDFKAVLQVLIVEFSGHLLGVVSDTVFWKKEPNWQTCVCVCGGGFTAKETAYWERSHRRGGLDQIAASAFTRSRHAVTSAAQVWNSLVPSEFLSGVCDTLRLLCSVLWLFMR